MSKVALVSQHLERISRAALERSQRIIRRYVHRRHGVYALYRGERLYYVGLASNLRSRLKGHLKDRHANSWDRFSVYLTVGDQHLRELEALLLRIGRPTGNKVTGRFPRSEDLLRRLKRDLVEDRRREVDEILGRTRAEPKVGRRGRRSKGKRFKLAVLFDLGKVQRRALRARFKGRRVRASVRQDGRVRCNGKLYDSPSEAAVAICGSAVNGWRFWTYERAPGDWASLRELRRRVRR